MIVAIIIKFYTAELPMYLFNICKKYFWFQLIFQTIHPIAIKFIRIVDQTPKFQTNSFGTIREN